MTLSRRIRPTPDVIAHEIGAALGNDLSILADEQGLTVQQIAVLCERPADEVFSVLAGTWRGGLRTIADVAFALGVFCAFEFAESA